MLFDVFPENKTHPVSPKKNPSQTKSTNAVTCLSSPIQANHTFRGHKSLSKVWFFQYLRALSVSKHRIGARYFLEWSLMCEEYRRHTKFVCLPDSSQKPISPVIYPRSCRRRPSPDPSPAKPFPRYVASPNYPLPIVLSTIPIPFYLPLGLPALSLMLSSANRVI